jgi:hypothetical protein
MFCGLEHVGVWFRYAGQKVSSVMTQADGTQALEVTVTLTAGLSPAPIPLTTTVPFATTRSSLLGCAHNQSCLTSSNCGNNYSCKAPAQPATRIHSRTAAAAVRRHSTVTWISPPR